MTEEAAAARPVGIIVKTARRVAVALTISSAVGLLLYNLSKSAPASFFVRAIVIGLSATTAFVLFEVWPCVACCPFFVRGSGRISLLL